MCESLAIGADETAGDLHDRLAAAGGDLLATHLASILEDKLEASEQDDDHATYAPKINNADARLDWESSADQLARAVRAYNPVPGAWFMLGDERVKCWEAEAVPGEDAAPATVVSADRDGIVIGCGAGALRMLSLQRPGKRPVTAGEFASQDNLARVRL